MQREMLLAMNRHFKVDAGSPAQQKWLKAKHHRESRKDLQVLLIHEGKLVRIGRVLAEPDAERIKHHILLRVAFFGVGKFQ